MFLRYTRSGIRAVVLLTVLLGALFGSSPGAAARTTGRSSAAPRVSAADAAPALRFLGQSPQVVQPGTGTLGASAFSVQLTFSPSVPSTAVVQLALYQKLTSRGLFEQIVQAGQASGSAIDTTSQSRQQLTPGPAGSAFFSTEVIDVPGDCGTSSSLDLACASGTAAGVYPLEVSVSAAAGGAALGRFLTFLTYATSNIGEPLATALVLPLSAPVAIHHRASSPSSALGALSPGAAAALRAEIASVAQYPTVPLTIEPSPQTLQQLHRAPSAADRLAVATLAGLSQDQHTHQIPAPSYVPVDLNALAAGGEETEIQGQLARGPIVMHDLGIATTSGSEAWVADSPVGPVIASGLAQVGDALKVTSTQLVVPESSVSLPARRGDPTWDSTFALGLSRGSSVAAAEWDSSLSAHFESSPGAPALEAQDLLADLAVIQSETPDVAGRGVVVVPPSGWTPNAAFDNLLLAGLAHDPVVEPVTLQEFFADVAPYVPTATGPSVHLTGSGTALAAGLAHQLSAARLRLTGFDRAVSKGQPVLTDLDQLLLASESSQLRGAQQRAAVGTFDASLDGQLSLVQISSQRTITLTARTGAIPVTLLSSAPYRVHGTLTLIGSKLLFPDSASLPVLLSRSTSTVHFQVEVRTSGDLPVEAVFTAPGGGLTIARAQLTVRSTATSLVGILLTVGALLVLGGWWARTFWAGRRRRRAAAAAQGRGGS